MPTDPTPTAADIEAARACWLTFAEFPTYIREEKAVHRIASALATAREAGQDVEVGRRRGLIDRARAEGRAESAERIAALQRDAEVAAAAENANAADLKAARGLLAEQQRAFVVAVEAMEARHDAEIAGIVEGLRERADALVQDDRFDAASALNDLADSIATTHAAALARHAGRNTTAEVPRD